MNASSSVAPPGMTWRETTTERGTHVYFSGTPGPRGLRQIGWGLLVIGLVLEILIDMLVGLTGPLKELLSWHISPMFGIVGGGVLVWMWRAGGPSYGSIDVERTALRVSRGMWLNPIQIGAREIARVIVGNRKQNYDITANGYEVRDTDRWYAAIVVTKANEQHVLACFGEEACATFFTRRISALLGTTVVDS